MYFGSNEHTGCGEHRDESRGGRVRAKRAPGGTRCHRRVHFSFHGSKDGLWPQGGFREPTWLHADMTSGLLPAGLVAGGVEYVDTLR